MEKKKVFFCFHRNGCHICATDSNIVLPLLTPTGLKNIKKIEFETTCTSGLKLCTDCKHMLFPLNFALKWLLLPTLKKGNYSYKTTKNV